MGKGAHTLYVCHMVMQTTVHSSAEAMDWRFVISSLCNSFYSFGIGQKQVFNMSQHLRSPGLQW